MNFLLTPDDEMDLVTFICEKMKGKLLASDVAPLGRPIVVNSPLSAISSELPNTTTLKPHVLFAFLFWLPDCGPIRTMQDAPPAQGAHNRVAELLNRESAGSKYSDLIDYSQTPILLYRRTKLLSPNRFAPGNLATMPLKVRELPQDVRRIHSAALRWLKSSGTILDPFDHCPEVRARRPRNLGSLSVCALPNAYGLVEQGVEVWPWNC